MSKLLLRIIIGCVLVVTVIYFGYQYAINIGARDFKTEKSAYTVDAKSISDEFTNNTDSSNSKYLNKAIEVSGTITNNQNNIITIDQVVSCQISEGSSLTKGEKVTVKGRVTGYDDLIGEIKMDQCLIVNNN